MADLLLMHKDTKVVEINFNEGKFSVVEPGLLPWTLRGKLNDSGLSAFAESTRKSGAVIAWLSHRVLPLSRDNAKCIYNLFGFSQAQDDYSKAKIALVCRAVSLQDDYWVKLDGDDIAWDSIDLRKNHLNEIVAQVALHGSSVSLQGTLTTPELTGQGAYAKAWIREPDGLYLHKLGASGSAESRIEVMCSDILDRCNVNHLKYSAGMHDGVYTCKCKCMTDEKISILPAEDFYSYCNVNSLNFDLEVMKIDAESVYKMWIVDYLIANRDRHGMNWGFFYESDTMGILGCHPLFDHNNAFDVEFMREPDSPYQANSGKSMRESARYAMKKVDFHFTAPITRDLFITDRQYKCFASRAKDLGITVISGR